MNSVSPASRIRAVHTNWGTSLPAPNGRKAGLLGGPHQ